MTYLDANVIIRMIEGDPATVSTIRSALAGVTQFVTSDLSRLECRCRPIRMNQAATLKLFDSFFQTPDLTVLPINRSVIDHATELRARFNIKTPDAIHAASALLTGVAKFATGDTTFARISNLPVYLF